MVGCRSPIIGAWKTCANCSVWICFATIATRATLWRWARPAVLRRSLTARSPARFSRWKRRLPSTVSKTPSKRSLRVPWRRSLPIWCQVPSVARSVQPHLIVSLSLVSVLFLIFAFLFCTGKFDDDYLVTFNVGSNMSWKVPELFLFMLVGAAGGLLGSLFNRIFMALAAFRGRHCTLRRTKFYEVITLCIITTCLTFLLSMSFGCRTPSNSLEEHQYEGTARGTYDTFRWDCPVVTEMHFDGTNRTVDLQEYNDFATLALQSQVSTCTYLALTFSFHLKCLISCADAGHSPSLCSWRPQLPLAVGCGSLLLVHLLRFDGHVRSSHGRWSDRAAVACGRRAWPTRRQHVPLVRYGPRPRHLCSDWRWCAHFWCHAHDHLRHGTNNRAN